MVTNFEIITGNGLSYLTTWGQTSAMQRKILEERNKTNEKEKLLKIINTYNTGIRWSYNGKIITLINKDVIKGCPSIDLNYVIAVYLNAKNEYQPPNNAIILNGDGSVHKKLCVPPLISNAAKERGWYKKQPNSSIGFTQVFQEKNGNNDMAIFLEIKDTAYGIFSEIRALDPIIGEFGECIYGGIEYK